MRQVITSAIWGMAATWVFVVGPLCWVLRDGLGPDASDSTGWVAVGRFLGTLYWGPVAATLMAAALIMLALEPRRRSVADAEAGKQAP